MFRTRVHPSHLILLAALALLGSSLSAQTSAPKPETLREDLRLLHEFAATAQTAFHGSDAHMLDQWWKLARRTAAKTGPHVIHALMQESESWQGEEVLLYVLLVFFLERQPTMKLIHEYQHSKNKAHATCAEDLISELDASDMRELYRKYARKNSR